MVPSNDSLFPSRPAPIRHGVDPVILVVEDEIITRTVIRTRLAKEKVQVLETGTGEGALAMLESADVDLVLLDVLLPGIDGFEVCRVIRSRGSSTAVIMLTQLAEREDKVQGLLLGADDYMTKPFDPDELVARIKAVLRRTKERGSQVEFRSLRSISGRRSATRTAGTWN